MDTSDLSSEMSLNMERRKRTNLDHLSVTEKRQRRKFNNRVSAQHARDRKKRYVEQLEAQVANLRAENSSLKISNSRLTAEIQSAKDSNNQLRSSGQSTSSGGSSSNSSGSIIIKREPSPVCNVRDNDVAMPESAALSVPPQQELLVSPHCWVLRCMIIITVLSITLTGWKRLISDWIHHHRHVSPCHHTHLALKPSPTLQPACLMSHLASTLTTFFSIRQWPIFLGNLRLH